MTNPLSHFSLSAHARLRMVTRGVHNRAVEAALLYGRVVRCRGAEIYVIGRKEVLRFAREGLDLSCHHGVQVVCSPDGGVLTVYRNHRLARCSSGPRRRRRCR